MANANYVKFADSSVVCLSCHEGDHDDCAHRVDGYWCECPCWDLDECAHCNASIVKHRGPQWSGWVAPQLAGHLRDVCYQDGEGTWIGHAPKEADSGGN